MGILHFPNSIICNLTRYSPPHTVVGTRGTNAAGTYQGNASLRGLELSQHDSLGGGGGYHQLVLPLHARHALARQHGTSHTVKA